MTPTKQTLFGKHTGDCLRAALATLLDLPIWKVPHFSSWSVAYWSRELERWVEQELDKQIWFVKEMPRDWCIAVGRSPRSSYPHAVVTKGCKLWFDPHPSNGMLVGDPQYYIVIEDKQ
jgi:hypothetical protein